MSPEKKQELREMSRMEALRAVREVLAVYRAQKASGRIAVDVRSGKAVWVKPVIVDVKPPETFPEETRVMRHFDAILGAFQEWGASGTVTLVVCQGRGVAVEKVVELEKVRVG